ncbi:hypothetical protein KFL_000130420 [Klebsormidium nitens]|uniref:Uncharacterized protein n=1 Tax=Klebsormidium nitens TaxID=105231 RepID=A0A1Y1HIX2_KLENI|nr:hypothetical protein KFL_000130420 [Klebsormidium nitens]|eukprot:GAQ78460.1 hypothetical protein KFL_000130420 [Klebsormidium nitens]
MQPKKYSAAAQLHNPFKLQWGHDGVNNLSPPTDAVSTTIGPFTPGTLLSITVTTLNNQPATEYFSKVRLIWSGRQEDFMASDTMEYGLECLPFKGTFGNAQVVWDFAAATMAPFTQSGLEIAFFFFQMNGVIGNVQASNLILTVELTDSLFAVTQKSYVVQIAQPAQTSNPTRTPTPTPTLTPTPTPTTNPQATSTPTPSPTSTAASPTTAPTPTPTQSGAPPTNTPTPTPTPPQATIPAQTTATCPALPARSLSGQPVLQRGRTHFLVLHGTKPAVRARRDEQLPADSGVSIPERRRADVLELQPGDFERRGGIPV